MYALIIDAAILGVFGSLPKAARDLTTGGWVCPEDGQWSTAEAEGCGYFEVTQTPRPADDATTTYDGDVQLVDGVPTLVWVARLKTPEEVAADTQQDNRDAIAAAVDQVLTDLATLRTQIANLPTKATIAADPAKYIIQLAQGLDTVIAIVRKIVRYEFNKLDAAD